MNEWIFTARYYDYSDDHCEKVIRIEEPQIDDYTPAGALSKAIYMMAMEKAIDIGFEIDMNLESLTFLAC